MRGIVVLRSQAEQFSATKTGCEKENNGKACCRSAQWRPDGVGDGGAVIEEARDLGIREKVRLYCRMGQRELSAIRDKTGRSSAPAIKAEVSRHTHAAVPGIGGKRFHTLAPMFECFRGEIARRFTHLGREIDPD